MEGGKPVEVAEWGGERTERGDGTGDTAEQIKAEKGMVSAAVSPLIFYP